MDKLNQPPAPSGPHDFAAMVAKLKNYEPGEDDVDILLACIREQQAALKALMDVANNAQCLHELEQARTTLTKYALEKS